jgi:hypothetical protein
MNTEKWIMRTAIAVWLLCIVGVAQAQTAWNTNILTATPPTTCSTGEPITACPILEYIYERSATATGTFAEIGRGPVNFTHLNAASGQNCYRAKTVATTGTSLPSNVVCKTNTAPVGPPNPPTLTVAATILGRNDSPAWTLGANNTRTDTFVGMAKVSTAVIRELPTGYRGFKMCEIGSAFIEPMKGFRPASGQRYVAPCA